MIDNQSHQTVLIGQFHVMLTLAAQRVYQELRRIGGHQILLLLEEYSHDDKVWDGSGDLRRKKRNDQTWTAMDCDHLFAKSLHDSEEIGHD